MSDIKDFVTNLEDHVKSLPPEEQAKLRDQIKPYKKKGKKKKALLLGVFLLSLGALLSFLLAKHQGILP